MTDANVGDKTGPVTPVEAWVLSSWAGFWYGPGCGDLESAAGAWARWSIAVGMVSRNAAAEDVQGLDSKSFPSSPDGFNHLLGKAWHGISHTNDDKDM